MSEPVIRTATCRCGQLSATASGDPVRISVCHCLDCQKRSGSAFAAQARFPADRVTIAGEQRSYVHLGDSGRTTEFHFCPTCGASLFYIGGGFPDLIAIAVGGFADPAFPPPQFSVWEERKHRWVEITGDGVEHFD
jgi:hypothetical protein